MRRILLRLVVVAVMLAMLLAMAVPAFAEGAYVVPKECREVPFGPEFCGHLVVTPSGNSAGWSTVENTDRDEAPDLRRDHQNNPSDFN
jgi:hypothetical protein